MIDHLGGNSITKINIFQEYLSKNVYKYWHLVILNTWLQKKEQTREIPQINLKKNICLFRVEILQR